MEFRTPVTVPDPGFTLGYSSIIMMQGSCFTVNIGNKLKYYGFNTDINTSGIIFNPVSVYKTLDIILNQRFFSSDDLIEYKGKWISLDHHGSFSDTDRDRCLEKINSGIAESAENLKKSSALFITWGTSLVYEHKKRKEIAANCHRLPADNFLKYRYNADSTVHIYTELLERLYSFNPSIKVIFTVSPVRHWRDGAIENQRSKAALHLAVDELTRRFGFTSYFPAYEIVMDDLRDYRFYAEDMIHPGPAAVEYIWEKFSSAYIAPEEKKWMEKVENIRKGLEHRPSGDFPEDYRKFLLQLRRKTQELKNENSSINLKEIIEIIEKKLADY
jgi:hypothetical protein